MGVTGEADRRGLQAEQRRQRRGLLHEVRPRPRAAEGAEVLAEVQPIAGGERQRALEVRAESEPRPPALLVFFGPRELRRQRQRGRYEAAAAAQKLRPAAHDLHDRVVERSRDAPVVIQEQVGDGAEPLPRGLGPGAQRLVAEVAAGGDQRPPDREQEQVVQRRVGQHHAEARERRRHARREPRAAGHEHDRRGRRAEVEHLPKNNRMRAR